MWLRIALASSLTLLTPSEAVAQEWSQEQQEVLAHLEACWDAWESKDLQLWGATCRPDPNFRHWPAEDGAPETLNTWRTRAAYLWSTAEVAYPMRDLRPLAVQVSGDTAIIYFYVTSVRTQDGVATTVQERRTEVFRRVSGQWTLLGGMRAPVG